VQLLTSIMSLRDTAYPRRGIILISVATSQRRDLEEDPSTRISKVSSLLTLSPTNLTSIM
jgi:hypothetical protein